MSEAVTALGGAVHDAAIRIADAGLRGMITLRGDFADDAFRKAATEAVGLGFPGQRQIVQEDDRGIAWMSPDEVLLMVPYAEAAGRTAAIAQALAGTPHLVADVSDARTVLVLEGPGVREVLAKGTPADLRPGVLAPGEIRRSRLGQVAAAFWLTSESRSELVCFRSVGGFVFDWLKVAGSEGSLPRHIG